MTRSAPQQPTPAAPPLWADTLIAFDTETTGVDPHTARVVTATIALVTRDGSVTERYDWLINPGVPIPERAAEVHGITTAVAEASGAEPAGTIRQIIATLTDMLGRGYPLAVFNAPYDLTLMHAEAQRHAVAWIDPVQPVIDPLVLDKALDRFRRGKRQLGHVAQHYGVTLDNAHDAGADAIATAHVAQEIARRFADQLPDDAMRIHNLQVDWAADQAARLQAYFEREGRENPEVDGSWPIRALQE